MKPDRKQFIQTSLAAAAALLASGPAFAMPQHETNGGSKQPRLLILATSWGFKGTTDEFCALAKKEGYDGIEAWWPMSPAGQEELFNALKKYDLQVGFLCGATQKNFNEHLAYFRSMIDAAAHNVAQRPLYINCHSGRDFFSFQQNEQFLDHTAQLARDTGILICHETHRSRMLFAAPVARQYIEKRPELRLTFDVSHWCNVSESLLQDQEENVRMAIDRAGHIHARIGHPEGPQVNDPRAPEWAAAVQAHLGWWDQIVARRRSNQEDVTILTEFGPVDYMPALPYSRQPLADQWAINVHMLHLLRNRYSKDFR